MKKGDKKLGNLSSTSNGEINISISRDVPEDIATLAFTTFISDVKQIKSELNVN